MTERASDRVHRTLSRRTAVTWMVAGASGLLATTAAAKPTAAATRWGVAAAQAQPSTLTVTRLGGLTPFWHPTFQTDGNQHIIYSLIFSTLVKVAGDERTLLPDLADSWEVSPDATTFTFSLNPTVTWHDGTPFTARDVAFTMTQAAQFGPRAYRGFAATNWMTVKGASAIQGTTNPLPGVEVLGDYTVRVTLERPNAEWLRNLPDAVYSIMPDHLLNRATAQSIETDPFATRQPVGTGPYKFTRYVPDQFVQLDAFPQHHRGAPKIQQIIYKIIRPELAIAQIEAGELDLALDVNVSERPRVNQIPGVTGLLVTGVGTMYLQFRTDNPVVADPRVRQAIYHGVDRRAILDGIFAGAGTPIWVPAGFNQELPELNRYDYDPARAQQLLRDANFDFNAPFRFIYSVGEPGWPEWAAAVQSYLLAMGINAELVPLDSAAWIARLNAKTPACELSLQCCGSEGLTPDRTSGYFNCQNPIGTFYANCAMDALFVEARSTGDPAKRAEIYNQLAGILNYEVPYLWQWRLSNFHVASNRLGGGFEIYPNPRESFYQAQTWDIAPR